MRNKLNSEKRLQRCQRRAVLASLILATATPVLAADPAGSLRIVSPLPLTAAAPSNRVQGNPFCEPELVPLSNPKVQLASDRQDSPIRMKPIGVAVGLRNIGEPDAPPPPTILVTPPVASQIQLNPMIGSAHNNELPSNEVLVAEPAVPSVSLPEPLSIEVVEAPVVDEFGNEDGMLDEPAHDELALDELALDDSALDESVGQEPAPTSEQPVEDKPEPILFSLTDNEDKEIKEPESDEAILAAKPSALGINPVPIDERADANGQSNAVVALAEPLVPIDFSSESLPSLTQAPGDKGPSIASPSKVESNSNSGIDASLVSSANRYRPPVAVSSSPIPLVRNESTEGIALIRPAVTRVESLNLEDAFPASASEQQRSSDVQVSQASAAVDLHMSKTQVRTLTIGGTFRRIKLADQAVCQAVHSGSNELKLIGTGCGVTELTIWADTGHGDVPKVRTFRIHVEDAVDAKGEAVGHKTETLSQSIARVYPNCRIQLRQENGQLLVTGDCDSDNSASGILRMVRKTCLIPVVDELRIR
jgi:Pilus formation protein N terminal region